MTTQRDLYSPMCARSRARQSELFDPAECPDSDLACGVCNRLLVRTESGYLACPRGHGRLITEAIEGDEP